MPDNETLVVGESDVSEGVARKSDSQLPSTGQHQSDSPDEVPTDLGADPALQQLGAHSVLLQLEGSQDVGPSVSLRPLDHEQSLPAVGHGRERYEVMKTLGVGSMAHVSLVADRDLRRRVAMKVIKPEARSYTRRFVEEAQILSQLDHPNIVPLHDLALTSDGRPYCTMRYLQGRTLADVLAERRAEAGEHAKVYTLTRLMQIYQQLLQAISYAHARGVIHRNLKPRNVMVGEHGEVQVADWGLAKVLGLTSTSQVVGTDWSHMSPEQAMRQTVDERTDIWALGAILYEILTLELPFVGKSARELKSALVGQEVDAPRIRAPHRNIPAELEAICLRCLDRRPDKRPQRVEEILAAVQAWLEASAEKSRRHELAEARAAEGRARLAEYRALKQDVERLGVEVKETAQRFETWQPIEAKTDLIDAQDRLRDARRALTKRATSVVGTLSEALGFEDDNTTARELLADYYWDRYLDAEARFDPDDVGYFANLVAQLHDGKYGRELRGNGSLTLTSDPITAEVWLYDLVEEGFLVVERNGRNLGSTPLPATPLQRGSYLVVLKKEGYRDTRYPVYIDRNRDWIGEVELYRDQEIREGFVYIPAGPFIVKGDPGAQTIKSRSEPTLPGFVLARHPVTMAEYLEFLNDLATREGIDAARARSPRSLADAPSSSMLVEDGNGGLALPRADADGVSLHPSWPAFAMSYQDAVAYCEWRSKRDGLSFRLPTSDEWEKAARGVDGRSYPWGWRFDPSLCNAQQSRREGLSPVSVEEFPRDVSIYGVRGLGGNVSDWTSTARIFGGAKPREVREHRGGAWSDPPWRCRAASTFASQPDYCMPSYGLRLARSLP